MIPINYARNKFQSIDSFFSIRLSLFRMCMVKRIATGGNASLSHKVQQLKICHPNWCFNHNLESFCSHHRTENSIFSDSNRRPQTSTTHMNSRLCPISHYCCYHPYKTSTKIGRLNSNCRRISDTQFDYEDFHCVCCGERLITRIKCCYNFTRVENDMNDTSSVVNQFAGLHS